MARYCIGNNLQEILCAFLSPRCNGHFMMTALSPIFLCLIFIISSLEMSHANSMCLGSPISGDNLSVASHWDDCEGTFNFSNGNRYTGNWKNGRFHGAGKFEYQFPIAAKGDVFVGSFKNGLRHGKGKHRLLSSGNETEGTYVDGMLQGFGTRYFFGGPGKGQSFQGNFVDDYINGSGKWDWPNGDSYEGNFVNEVFSGQGTLRFASGAIYVGEFRNGLRHGVGRMTYPPEEHRDYHGGSFEGRFVNGVKTVGIENSNEGRYEGSFRDGLFSGDGKFFHKDGTTFVGKYKKGKKDGFGTFYQIDGSIKKVFFIDDIPSQNIRYEDYLASEGGKLQNLTSDQHRVALVVGNSSYGISLGKLKNPSNDARLISRTLMRLGFEVIQIIDGSQASMKRAVQKFAQKLKRSDGLEAVGVFYYAGHGMQVNGMNYLIPVDAEVEVEADVDIESVSASDILTSMEQAKATYNFIILDACRNNPLIRASRSATRGLARMSTSMGSLIAYSTAPGAIALDGDAGNSPYTIALVEAMNKDVPVEKMFREVRTNVMNVTNNRQIPWESSSLVGDDFYFSGAQ